MEINDILYAINGIFVNVLGDGKIKLNEFTVAQDVPGWDSLTHIQLIVAVEKHFKIRFTTAEIMGFNNVGDLCRKIRQKIDNPPER